MRKIISISLVFAYIFNLFPVFALDFSQMQDKDYFISPGDILNMVVFPASEFSKEVTVQPDGTIDIPLLGAIKAAGMRSEELEKILASKFSKYVSNPSVTINVRKFSTYRVAIIGQIQRAGYYDFSQGMKILDLVALAGGLQDYARTKDVKIFRKIKDANGNVREESFEINLEDVLEGKLGKNIELVAGDIVYIPRKRFTTTTKWITDNLIPWTMLATFAMTIGIISRK
jgi:polysaccharide export outer membrane protein